GIAVVAEIDRRHHPGPWYRRLYHAADRQRHIGLSAAITRILDPHNRYAVSLFNLQGPQIYRQDILLQALPYTEGWVGRRQVRRRWWRHIGFRGWQRGILGLIHRLRIGRWLGSEPLLLLLAGNLQCHTPLFQ